MNPSADRVATPYVLVEFPLEAKARPRIVAASREDELRVRGWFRAALGRRRSLSDELLRWLDELDATEPERRAA